MGISEQIIPAAAVVAGSLLTIGGQALVGRGQRKDERRTKLLQEKREAYADFRSCARRVRETHAALTGIEDVELAEAKKARAAIGARLDALHQALNLEIKNYVPDDADHARRVADIRSGLEESTIEIRIADEQQAVLSNKVADIRARFTEVQKILERAESVVDFTASTRVRAAARLLEYAANNTKWDDDEFRKADQTFVEAVRRELQE